MRLFLAIFVVTFLSSASAHSQAETTETAVLYQQVPGIAAGRRTEGTVTWELTKPEGAAAVVRFPKKQSVSISVHKNTDTTVPATHLIDIKFQPCAGSISSIPGILAKPEERKRGEPLAGLSVKSGCDHFLIGLSATPEDRERNSKLITINDWLDIPIEYSNGYRGILAIKKSKIGSSAIMAIFSGITHSDAQQDSCKALPSPQIGMTADDVRRTCWGSPKTVIKKTTSAGVEESYVYSLGHIVTLVDGKVTEIIESE